MEEEINLREYIEVIRKRWKVIVVVTIVVTLLAFVYSVRQKPMYEAKAKILIRSGSSGGVQFANLIGIMSGSGNIGDLPELLKSKAVAANTVAELLKSRVMGERVLDRLGGNMGDTIKHRELIMLIGKMLSPIKVNGNIIELRVNAEHPQLAADVANAYVDSISSYWNQLNYEEAYKKKQYIESQLPRVEKDLRNAEIRFKQYSLITGQSAVPPLSSGINIIETATNNNSQSAGIKYAHLSRELDILVATYASLRNDYETVKLEEAKALAPFAVVDHAEIPLGKSRPDIKLNLIIGLLVGFFSGTFTVFFQEYWEKSSQNIDRS